MIKYYLKFSGLGKAQKIRSKEDAKRFLTDTFFGEAHVIISPDSAIGIYHKRGCEPYVTVKNGDIYDVFNPELRLEYDESVNAIFQFRKLINAEFLTMD